MIVDVHVMRGEYGFSLQIMGKHIGERISGPRSWDNKPLATFRMDAQQLIESINQHAYTPKGGKDDK